MATVLGVLLSLGIFAFGMFFFGAWLLFVSFDRIKQILWLLTGWLIGPIQNTIFGKLLKKAFNWFDHLSWVEKIKSWYEKTQTKIEAWLRHSNKRIYKKTEPKEENKQKTDSIEE